MNFLAIDQTLRTVLNAITGITSPTAQDEGQSQFFPQIGTGAITDGHGNPVATGDNSQAGVTYEIISVSGIGRDELRRRYDGTVHPADDTYAGPGAPLGSIIEESTGNREIHVQIQCECFTALDGNKPFAIVERVRTALSLPSVLDLLNTAGLAIQNKADTITSNYFDDNGRQVGVAILEVIFNAADGVEDIPVTTIETVERPAITVHGLVTDP